MVSTFQLPHPFNNAEVTNVRLSNAPLVRVFVQARWQEISTLKSDFDAAADKFAVSVSDAYPFRSDSHEVNFLITPDGPQQQTGGKIVQLRSANEEWRVYFTATFLTLETTNYVDIEDACARFGSLLDALGELVKIPRTSRLGFRYVDRIAEPTDFANLEQLVRVQVNGGAQVPTNEHFSVSHSLTESLFQSDSGSLLAKWATLPGGGTHDPSIEPVDTPSWVLDLDSFQDVSLPFERTAILAKLQELSLIGYRFFRWSVQAEFAERFGAIS